ncbi:MAG TPA: hypothetical protein PK385_11680 [Spirochaetota bacterium]|nr:hypothetical protein [Spirochaetota bacterium]HOS33548.1 hypothetical protein [Spirochaetota bacterium]HOS56702.1 hypothetical protein [Spirochaetota bacterium]HQF78970.1 hypothetical protein [Spirochaetota bacterium]HQH31046.1 hypothetical protein [Spirochaetota bacterium]
MKKYSEQKNISSFSNISMFRIELIYLLLFNIIMSKIPRDISGKELSRENIQF